MGEKSYASLTLAWSCLVLYWVEPPKITMGALLGFSPTTAPVTTCAPTEGAVPALTRRVGNTSGWLLLLVRLTLTNHDQSPFLLPSDALAWEPP